MDGRRIFTDANNVEVELNEKEQAELDKARAALPIWESKLAKLTAQH